jgi:hypothetical protein
LIHTKQEQTPVEHISSIESFRPSFFRPPELQQPIQPPTPHVRTSNPDKLQQFFPSLGRKEENEKSLVYQAFELYFNNPQFIKTNSSSESYSIYYAKVQSMINEFRYLILTTTQDMAQEGTIRPLKELAWNSFQLRILDKEIHAPESSYSKTNNGVFDDEIVIQKRDKIDNKVIYQCKFNPLTVELLPSKKGTIQDYPDKATLELAIETFHCVMYFS